MEQLTPLLVPFLTLAALEIVLGIDNVIFITILADKLPKEDRPRARRLGLGLAVISRIVLLFGIGIIVRLTQPLFEIGGHGFSGRDILLLLGGLFLIAKSTREIHHKLEAQDDAHGNTSGVATMGAVLAQIMLVDVVFSLDSVITAVGITDNLPVMISAVLLAAAIMVIFADPIGDFVERHPAFKILALAFLIMIGALLVIEGWDHDLVKEFKIKNYIYFTMAFSVIVEFIQLQLKPSKDPVKLHNQPSLKKDGEDAH